MQEQNVSVSKLEEALGHTFVNAALLEAALTHPSMRGRGKRWEGEGAAEYERLEFLGDRVLGLVVAEELYRRFPLANEGELAKRHASMVSRDALRPVALAIDLDKHLKLARGEDALDARRNLAVLSDAVEALIGAMYLDTGLEAPRRFIQAKWNYGDTSALPSAEPKTALQEWAQSRGLPLPAYTVVERSGPAHAPDFTVEVTVKGQAVVRGNGNTIRAAEKAAAAALLESVDRT